MAGTDRQKKKFEAFDVECTRLAAVWARYAEAWCSGDLTLVPRAVNLTAATKALNRYRHHKAGIMGPASSWAPGLDAASEGRNHVAWARTALRQAAKLLGTDARV